MLPLYSQATQKYSRVITTIYSTSFASAINMLHKKIRQPIYNIYGFVRLADEIVDTFHSHDKESLLSDFKTQTYLAINQKLSTNSILHSFQITVNQYQINIKLIEAFFNSMEFDLTKKNMTKKAIRLISMAVLKRWV